MLFEEYRIKPRLRFSFVYVLFSRATFIQIVFASLQLVYVCMVAIKKLPVLEHSAAFIFSFVGTIEPFLVLWKIEFRLSRYCRGGAGGGGRWGERGARGVCSSANHIAVQRRVSNKTETTTIVLLSIPCFQMELYKFQLHCLFYHFSWLAHSEGQSEINLTDYNLSTTIRDMGRYARYDARCRARHASSDGEEEEPCDRKSRKRKNGDSNGPRMSKSENDIDRKRKRFQ